MSAKHRTAFFVSQQLTPALVNAVLNGGIAWAMHRGTRGLALWGDGGYAIDLLATGFLLPGITWLILHPLLRRQAAAGKAPAIDGIPRPWLAALLPSRLWSGALAIGLAGTVVGGLVCAVMQALGAPAMDGTTYAVFKGGFGALLPLLLQPAMVFAILPDPRDASAAKPLGEIAR